MDNGDTQPSARRVLLLASSDEDTQTIRSILEPEGLVCAVCGGAQELLREWAAAPGAVVLTEDALEEAAPSLAAWRERQPSGQAGLPLIVALAGARPAPESQSLLGRLGEVLLLERPLGKTALLSAVRLSLSLLTRQRGRERATRELEALRRRVAHLAENDQRKNEYLAMLAHELRNPLAPIRNALQILLLRRTPLDTKQSWALEIINRQVDDLVRLVDNLLDVSRFTRGKIELALEPVSVSEVLGQAIETAQPLIEARHHILTVRTPPEGVRVQADPVRLAQVVANLLHNAAKYTDDGGRILVQGELAEGEVVIRVKDSGIGIPPEILTQVFDLFTQAERPLDRAKGGAGLGLTMVRRLVELHGGRIEALSGGLGQGSEFVIRLPLLEEPEQAGAPPHAFHEAPFSGGSRRILVVDDVSDMAESLKALLENQGHVVRIALNGPEALEGAGDFQPEIVLLDIGLPGMDGYEVARRLRHELRQVPMLLVALTGYGQESDRHRAREAGFDFHLLKPVNFTALNKLIATVAP